MPLDTTETSPSAGNGLSYFGVSFETPWSEVGKVKLWASAVRVQFKEGQFVFLWNPKQAVDPARVSKDAAAARGRDIADVYGEDAVKSNYAFLRTVLYLTPAQVSLFSGFKTIVRDAVFLQLKHLEMKGAETGLYFFQLGTVKGFQKGDPAKVPVVLIEAFDAQDRDYQVWVGKTLGTRGQVTQQDINLILSTLRTIPSAWTKSDAENSPPKTK
jgi:hypothetical protein